MVPIRLIHITPELSPTVGGVADYTAILSRRLVEVSDGAIKPVLIHAGKKSARTIDVDFPVEDLSGQCSAASLAKVIGRWTSNSDSRVLVLLQYSNYGYAKRGIPWRLIRGLTRACGQKVALVSMLHELYATGPPWEGSFWYSLPQRYMALRLAQMSTRVVVNRQSAASWLRRHPWIKQDMINVQPVFSNVGEPTELRAFQKRSRSVVVFGGKKSQIYEENLSALYELKNQFGFEKITDIGPSEHLSAKPGSIAFRGILPAADISNELQRASLGLISYPASRLSKSGGAAAYASHGVPFLLFDEEDGSRKADPYVEGKHFWRWSTISDAPSALENPRLEEMSRSIRSLYMRKMHSRLAAQCFSNIFKAALSVSPESDREPTP